MNNEIKEMTVKEIEDALGYNIKIIKEHSKIQLAEVPQYETFKIDNIEFIVLKQLENGKTFCLTKNFIQKYVRFDGNTNNLAKASILQVLDDFEKKIAAKIGADNMCEFKINLTTDDGLKDYGFIKRKTGLLTDAQYRQHSIGIQQYAVDDWWWLATAVSTPCRCTQSFVRCVACGGYIDCISGNNCRGVRAVCLFDSSMFVKK